MKNDLLLAFTGAAIGAATAAMSKFRCSPDPVNYPELVAFLRRNLATTLDSLQAARSANDVLQHGVNERDAELVAAQAQLTRSADAIQGLLKALNAANVRCAELQNELHRRGLSAESAYFMAVLGDGSVAGPFSRN